MTLLVMLHKLIAKVVGNMPMYETTVHTPEGPKKERVYAENAREAKKLFEQRHGPRNVPYIPHMVPS